MVDFFKLRVIRECKKRRPPSYEDKVLNCSFPQCDEDGVCDLGCEIINELRQKDKENASNS